MIPPLFKTDEELSERSLCLWWTRCAVRGYGDPPRPPIGRERRDREQYRHEGTNYPPTIATTIRTRPPPPSATTPRFDVRDEEGRTKSPREGWHDNENCDRKREITQRAQEEGCKNAWTINRSWISLSFFFPHFGSIFLSLLMCRFEDIYFLDR